MTHPNNCNCEKCWGELEREAFSAEELDRIAAYLKRTGQAYVGDLHHLRPMGTSKKKLPPAKPRHR
jgi:hypothetical protein